MKTMCNIYRKRKESPASPPEIADDGVDIVMLVDKAAGGDFRAFGQLYSIYLNRIYRYVLYHVKDRMTAEDITDEVFIKAWKAIKSCKNKGHTFSAWIYRIAHNQLINTLRNLNKFSSVDIEKVAEVDTIDLSNEITPDQQELLDAIAELPPNQTQVITLKFIEGLDNREIGEIIGKSEGAIRVLQLRGLTALRQKLGGGKYGARC
jgi:RNA polymerase sigma-70 factor (ECF subfamily)